MDQVINMIQQRTGIDQSQARTAADTVVNFLRDNLPGPVAGQIDDVISGSGSTEGSTLDRAADALGGQKRNPSR